VIYQESTVALNEVAQAMRQILVDDFSSLGEAT